MGGRVVHWTLQVEFRTESSRFYYGKYKTFGGQTCYTFTFWKFYLGLMVYPKQNDTGQSSRLTASSRNRS